MSTIKTNVPRDELLPKIGAEKYEVILEDLEFGFEKTTLKKIAKKHNGGMCMQDIADQVGRNEYEILLAIVHLHKKNRITRKIGGI